MKRIIATTLCAAVLLISCKKEHICVCSTISSSNFNQGNTQKTYKTVTKRKAEGLCKSYEMELSSGSNLANCELQY